MPRTVTDVDLLQEYIRGVMSRAEHHARGVDEVCLTIAGAIIWRKDGDIRVYEREGEMKNALWIDIDGRSYALSYNHDNGAIEVKEDSMRGDVLAAFTNDDSASRVKDFFSEL